MTAKFTELVINSGSVGRYLVRVPVRLLYVGLHSNMAQPPPTVYHCGQPPPASAALRPATNLPRH